MKHIKISICLLSFIFKGALFYLSCQTYNDKLPVTYENLKFADILDSLSRKFKINFTYNADLPIVNEIKSVKCNCSLEEILNTLLNNENLDFNILNNQVIIFPLKEMELADSIQGKDIKSSISGYVIDKNNRDPLPFASITIKRKSIGTVANTQGEFTFRISKQFSHDTVEFSYIGYKSKYIIADSLFEKKIKIELIPIVLPIKAVIVKSYSGLELVRELVNRIPKNYSNRNSVYTAFYRETTREDNDYITICEAVVDISKVPYNNQFLNDQAKVFKGRRSENVKKVKNLRYKLEGGVYNCLRLDVIKDNASFLSEESFDDYDYNYVKQMVYENRELYVVTFDQKENVELPLYKGTLYIDKESMALVAINFGLSPKGLAYANELLIKKRPRKFSVKPLGTNYQVFYRNINGKWYLAYLRGELRIKAKSTKLFFNSTFTSVSEMAITGIDTTSKIRFKWKETAKPNDILVDNVANADSNFWSNYIIIQPEQSIMDAVNKLNIKKNIASDESLWKKLF